MTYASARLERVRRGSSDSFAAYEIPRKGTAGSGMSETARDRDVTHRQDRPAVRMCVRRGLTAQTSYGKSTAANDAPSSPLWMQA